MEKEELIELVKKIQAVEGSEEEIDGMIDEFLENVPDPNASDYIFEKEYEDLTPQEIVDKALSYRPIQL